MILTHLTLLSFILVTSIVSAFVSFPAAVKLAGHSRITVTVMSTTAPAPWWAGNREGLKFKCTECGKCCQNEGEVWMDPAEFSAVAAYLNISIKSLLLNYSEQIVGGWAKMTNKKDTSGNPDKCIFLGEDRKSCTIYPVRPNQCRTYPWWPRLLMNESNWLAEAVVPEDSSASGRKWTPEFGGCEGINNADSSAVSALKISRNLELSTLYNSMLPYTSFLSQDEEKQKFITKTEIIQAVVKSTKAWVREFVVKYNLCPFAESVFVNGNIRYCVFMGRTRDEILSLIKFEILHLLTTPEEETATTLLMLPFAFSDFEEYYDFSLELEDDIIPAIEEYTRPEYTNKDYLKLKDAPKNKLSSILKKRKRDYIDPEKEIQVATFHPNFQWADTEASDPLNFEKRSPFPTINLLRASKIKKYASEGKTTFIADSNKSKLEEVGFDVLYKEFEQIIKLALDS